MDQYSKSHSHRCEAVRKILLNPKVSAGGSKGETLSTSKVNGKDIKLLVHQSPVASFTLVYLRLTIDITLHLG